MKCPYSFVVDPGDDNDFYHRLEFGSSDMVVRGVVVPCGKCLVCQQNRASEWAARLVHELQYHEQACFITLTYDEVHVPKLENDLMTLRKKDYQDFFKRLRKNLDVKIKYFLCGEYGSKFHRPHYHAIVFGWSPAYSDIIKSVSPGYSSSKLLEDIWSLGNCTVGAVSGDSIHYTSGYVLKNTLPKEDLLGRVPPFLSSSQGMGLQYALDHSEAVKNINISAEGTTCAVPRYYLKKLGGVNRLNVIPQTVERSLAFMRKKLNQNDVSDLSVDEIDKMQSLVKAARDQSLIDVRAKLDVMRRKKNKTL
jgi:hypothetical protein